IYVVSFSARCSYCHCVFNAMKFESRLNYVGWQGKLQESSLFRRWWQFWSNYAFIFFAAAGLGLTQQYNGYQILVLSFISFVVARGIVTTLINLGYHRVRPYQLYKFNPITSRFFSLQTAKPNSFPSRHTTAFTSVAAVVTMFNPVAGIILYGVTVMTGLGRIVLGYHYPTDILGGLTLGTLIGVLTVFIGSILLFT
ncbi:MAG: phosphatase PAP2 family protein, partial [bacterium]|nr:phosphatase PAP2 family protein [bacterium]